MEKFEDTKMVIRSHTAKCMHVMTKGKGAIKGNGRQSNTHIFKESHTNEGEFRCLEKRTNSCSACVNRRYTIFKQIRR